MIYVRNDMELKMKNKMIYVRNDMKIKCDTPPWAKEILWEENLDRKRTKGRKKI